MSQKRVNKFSYSGRIRSDVIFLIVVLVGIFLFYSLYFLYKEFYREFMKEGAEADTSSGFIFRYDIDTSKQDVILLDKAQGGIEEEIEKSYEIVGIWQIDAPNKFPIISSVDEEVLIEEDDMNKGIGSTFSDRRGDEGCNVCNSFLEAPCGNYKLYYLELEIDNRTKGEFLDIFGVKSHPLYEEKEGGLKGLPKNALKSYSLIEAKRLGGWPLIRLKSKDYRNVKIYYNIGKNTQVSYISKQVPGKRILSRCSGDKCYSTLQIFSDILEVIPGSAFKIIDCRTGREDSFTFSGCGIKQGPFCILGRKDCPFNLGKK